MFQSKTLLIVGAGGSCELGLPSGAELKKRISDRLDIRFPDGFTQRSGDYVITESLKALAQSDESLRGDINPFLQSAWRIRDALPQAISIDNYLDAHSDDVRANACGKLAIVRSILAAERNSHLFLDQNRTRPDFGSLQTTWHTSFFKMATEGVRRDRISEVFSNVTIITFNYDRCIEHYLVHALCNYYGMDENDAHGIISQLKIYHPYGAVGCLPWQSGKTKIPFGAEARNLLDISPLIKTFSERIEDEEAVAELRRAVKTAETIVFLGYAFHQQNMELIRPKGESAAKRAFATVQGISQSDCNAVGKDIVRWLGVNPRALDLQIRRDLSCFALFDEYWRTLPRAA